MRQRISIRGSVHPSVCLSICLSVHSSVPPPSHHWALDEWLDGRMDRWTDGQTYAQISPLFYRTLSPLSPLPCLLSNCHRFDHGQGKGTADRLLPLVDWFFSSSAHVPYLLFHPLHCTPALAIGTNKFNEWHLHATTCIYVRLRAAVSSIGHPCPFPRL